LTAEKLQEFEQEVQEASSKSPIRNAVIWDAWDFTVHIDRRTNKARYWQPHYYLVIATRNSKAVLDRVLLSMVERSEDVPIPKQIGNPDSL